MLQKKSTIATSRSVKINKCTLTHLYSSQVRQPRRLSSVYGTHGRIHPKSGKSREILGTRCYASRGEIELDTKPNGEHSKTPDLTVASQKVFRPQSAKPGHVDHVDAYDNTVSWLVDMSFMSTRLKTPSDLQR